VCAPENLFLTSEFNYLLFSNPTHKTKALNANRWETEPTHLDQSKYIANQQQVLGFAIPFTNLSMHCKNAGPKPFY
jgi:hypothetical protein